MTHKPTSFYFELGKNVKNLSLTKEILDNRNFINQDENNTSKKKEREVDPKKKDLESQTKNTFLKIMPTFLKWIENDQKEKILAFCNKRFEIYKNSGVYKRGIRKESKNPIILQIHKYLTLYQNFIKDKKYRITLHQNQNSKTTRKTKTNYILHFLEGFFYKIKYKEVKPEWTTKPTFMHDHSKISFVLGILIKEIAILQINILKNKGLIKNIQNYANLRTMDDIKQVFYKTIIVFFRIRLKKSVKGYLYLYIKYILNNINEIEGSSKNHLLYSQQIESAFLMGILVNASKSQIIEKRRTRFAKRQENPKRKFLLPQILSNNLSYELGQLFHVYAQNEIDLFESRKFARIAANSRNLNSIKIFRLAHYIMTMAVRIIIKYALDYKFTTESNEFNITYPYSWTLMSLCEYLFFMNPDQIPKNQASLGFMIGYHSYWKVPKQKVK